jgi:hypothetical protein
VLGQDALLSSAASKCDAIRTAERNAWLTGPAPVTKWKLVSPGVYRRHKDEGKIKKGRFRCSPKHEICMRGFPSAWMSGTPNGQVAFSLAVSAAVDVRRVQLNKVCQ